MPGRDLKAALEAASRRQAAQGMPDEVDQRLREKLGLAPARSLSLRWLMPAAPALAAAAVALAVVFWPRPAPGPQVVEGFAVVGPSAGFSAQVLPDRLVEFGSGSATLEDGALGLRLEVAGRGAIRREGGAVRVQRGTLTASVRKRAPGAEPLRVLVSGGAIEVLGTRFTVQERGEAGRVELHEGSIRFVALDGRQALLTPGESLVWPLPPAPQLEPAPEPAPQAALTPTPLPKPVPAPRPARAAQAPAVEDVDSLLNRIATLRRRGQYAQATAELEKALEAGYEPATLERLSFELGTILRRSESDRARACEHWRRHAAQFAGGRYAREIELDMERLRCASP